MGTDLSKSESEFSSLPHNPLESSLSHSNAFRLHHLQMERENTTISQNKRYTETNQKRGVAILNSTELIKQTQQYNNNKYGESNLESTKSSSTTIKNNVHWSLPILPNQKFSFARSREISPTANSTLSISYKPARSNSGTLKNKSLPSLSNNSIANSKDNLETSSKINSKESKSHDNAYKINVSHSSLVSAEKSSNYICDKKVSKSNYNRDGNNKYREYNDSNITRNEENGNSEDAIREWLAATESELVLEWNCKRREREEEIENEALQSWSENFLQHPSSEQKEQKHYKQHYNKHYLCENEINTYDTYKLCDYNKDCNYIKKSKTGNHKTKYEWQDKYNESNWKPTRPSVLSSHLKYTSSSSSSTSSSSSSSSSSSEEEISSEMKVKKSKNKEIETKLSDRNDAKAKTSTPRVPLECDAVPFPFNRSTGVIYKVDNTHENDNDNDKSNKINHSAANNNNNNSSHLANMSNAAYPKLQLKEIPVGEQYYEALRDAWRQPSERGTLLPHPSRNFSPEFVHEIVAEITDKDRTKEFAQHVPLQPIIGVLCRNWEEEGLYDQVF